jgi:hypothetical protein
MTKRQNHSRAINAFRRSAGIKPARSRCYCGHTGDGNPSQHYGLVGHGPCSLPGCECKKFTWKEFIEKK